MLFFRFYFYSRVLFQMISPMVSGHLEVMLILYQRLLTLKYVMWGGAMLLLYQRWWSHVDTVSDSGGLMLILYQRGVEPC